MLKPSCLRQGLWFWLWCRSGHLFLMGHRHEPTLRVLFCFFRVLQLNCLFEALNSWLKCFVYILEDLSWYLCSVLSWRQLTALWACESQHSQSLLFTYLIRSKGFPTIEDDQIYNSESAAPEDFTHCPAKRGNKWIKIYNTLQFCCEKRNTYSEFQMLKKW